MRGEVQVLSVIILEGKQQVKHPHVLNNRRCTDFVSSFILFHVDWLFFTS